MNCNGLANDQIFHKRELLVPIVEGFVMQEQPPMTVEQEMINIELKREAAVKMMAEHI